MKSIPTILLLAGIAFGDLLHAQPPRPAPLSPDARAAVVNSVRRAVLDYYVFPDTARRMAARLLARLGAKAYDSAASPQALVADLRAVHADAHLRIVFDPDEAKRAADTTRRERQDRLPIEKRNNFYFRDIRILPGNIGYVEFTQFADTSVEARKTIQAAMWYLSNTSALIIDLRDNRGGSAAMGGEIASYFVSGRAHWSDSYNRIDNTWTQGWFENSPTITGGLTLTMPLRILTSSWTFSGAEGLAYGLQNNRGARVVGEQTAGGAHVLRRLALGNGFVGFIPYRRSANVITKTDWEGTGVTPDIRVDAPAALLVARKDILEERLRAATDSATIRSTRWAINSAIADERNVFVSAAVLAAYSGKCEEYLFSVREGRLYSTNSSRNNKLTQMWPISATLFQIDSESQIEFLVDAGGAVTGTRLFWNDGAVDSLSCRR